MRKLRIPYLKNMELQEKCTIDGHYIIPYADFNMRLQEDFNIVNEIAHLIVGAGGVEMFVTNEFTRKQQLNPKLLSNLKQFSMLKKVVQSCSNERNMLDLTMMKQFCNQILIHEQLGEMIVKYKDVDIDIRFSRLIHSFLVLRPREITLF